jgi:eukaryotic-like serine/threonine-protein kinase
MISSPSDGHTLEALAAHFIARRRDGERPSAEEYAAQHPELAAEIRDLFPTIGILEDARQQQEPAPAASDRRPRAKLNRLGDFRVVREIGRGGMGIVYEAVQESLRRRVAVKVLASRLPFDEKDRKRFLREARTAGQLHHTNIVPILGVGEQDGYDFYVMQFIDGVGLDAVLSRLRMDDHLDPQTVRLSAYWHLSTAPHSTRSSELTPTKTRVESAPDDEAAVDRTEIRPDPQDSSPVSGPPIGGPAIGGTQPLRLICRNYWHDVALVGLQVAEALDYAHSQGTLHRDIKPANLLLDVHGTTWVADFGLAKGIEQEAVSRTGEVLGTLLYMAPEQWSGKADARSDIYSLGVTLYELLTLRVPCQIQDRMKALRPAGLHPTIVPPRKLSPSLPLDLETIVMKAIAEEPEHRYQTAADLAGDLSRFLEDRPISVRRPTLRERWSRWRRRNPAAAILSVAAASMAVALAIGLSIAYAQTRASLARESAERRRAERTLATSLQTLENVFRHLVPDQIGQTRALTVTTADGSSVASSGTQPVVSPETAALLEDLRNVYDELGSAGGTNVGLSTEAARATRRLGDIYQRLGNYERAESAYRLALEKFTALSERDATGQARLDVARVHNELGSIYGRASEVEMSQKEHRQALAMLEEQPNPGSESRPEHRFELARTYFFLGRGPDRASNPSAADVGRHPPGPPPEGDRPGDRPPLSPDQPPDSETGKQSGSQGAGRPPHAGDPEKLKRAIVLLEALVAGDPKKPGYRYLLAQCYREDSGPESGPLPEIERAEKLLRELVADFPNVADYRYELADTCSLLDVRNLPPEEFRRAELRLRSALEQSADLVDGHPYAPDYTSLHVHILHKLARILRDTPPNRGDDDRARMDEAGQLYQEAVRRQAALVKRFPEDVNYRFWQASIRMSTAQFLLERRQPAEARTILETALSETEKFSQAHPKAASLTPALQQLYLHLSEALDHLDDPSAARLAREKAGKLGPIPPTPRDDRGPPDHHHRPPPRQGPGDPPPPDGDE